ncbi:hypothetical protein [Mesorhizobium sp.]|uniref:hypothetical protein n=1 Tax=Mesorhizobium sp. TaxID=1871066 RepID=UPI000FE2E878|nr:hypothetical protein [Mesorhizobium sp.]RWQ12712.1 MAG: hypothetical protein EOR92_32930 [Mesorhizobium sp.]
MVTYLWQKDAIVRVLHDRAKQRRTIFYSELGATLGIPAQGPWKPILDEISREETAAGRPDITYLVVSKTTNLPGQIGFTAAKPPSADQTKRALETIEAVFEHYS